MPTGRSSWDDWGLKVVEQLAAAWGTERRSDGYRVSAELELPT
jgi:hypothetical protein